jgi:uncharacterized protein (TIGR03000 family)
MFRKYFFTSALASLAVLLLVTDMAQAQRLGNRRERRQERRDMRRGVVYTDVAVPAATATTMQRTAHYYTPEIIAGDLTGHVRVLLPNPQAKVFFDGTTTTQTGTERLYNTPPLAANATTMYRIRVTWMQDNREIVQERQVPVLPGRTVVVDFRQR